MKKGFVRLRKHFWAALWGMGAILAADQLSQATPLWPALTLAGLVAGMLFPPFFSWQAPKGFYALSGYFGGLFYLEPWLAGVAMLLALEILIVAGDALSGAILFVSLIPFLLSYARWNQDFIWAAAGIALLFLFYAYPELWNRFRNYWETPS